MLIVGSGRSGTTWLSDEIAAKVGTRTIFEPLQRSRVPGVPSWGHVGEHAGKFLTCRDNDSEMDNFFERLLSGEICNTWTRQDWRLVPRWTEASPFIERFFYHLAARRNRRRTRQGTHSVIKFIKANLMLDWIDHKFDVKIIYVIRHPCQVIGSRLKHKWRFDVSDITQQPELMRRELSPFKSMIESARTPVQQLAATWCVENRIPLLQSRRANWICQTYEDCIFDTERVFDAFDQFLIGEQNKRRKSRIPNSNLAARAARPDASRPWHHPLSEQQGEEVLAYCRDFGIQLYGRCQRPQVSIAEAIR